MKTNQQHKLSENIKRIPPSFIREILTLANKPGMISFAGGLPNPKFFPSKELTKSSQRVLLNNGNEILQYAESQGYLPLRKWIANRYNKKYNLSISPQNVVITNGSQQTIDIVSKMFLNQHDQVIVEKPTYLGGLQALNAYSPDFLEVNLGNNGPNLEEIESFCLNQYPKFMYAIPNYQNPTGICYSKNKREQLASLLKQYDLLLLEDDPYNEISFANQNLPPLYKLAPNHVFWSGSFSKMIAPGLRLAWVVVPDQFTSLLVKAKQSTDLHPNNLSQHIIYDYLIHNNIDIHLNQINNAYKQQANFMTEMIKKYFPNGVKITSPQGGMFIWATFPNKINTYNLAMKCIEKGIAIVPGNSFFANSINNHCIRMNFSNSSFNEIENGVKIVAEELKKMMTKPILIPT